MFKIEEFKFWFFSSFFLLFFELEEFILPSFNFIFEFIFLTVILFLSVLEFNDDSSAVLFAILSNFLLE